MGAGIVVVKHVRKVTMKLRKALEFALAASANCLETVTINSH
jgi:hypothetical protein